MDAYAASCNPPRRAKRPRAEELPTQKPLPSQLPPRAVPSASAVPILPKQPSAAAATSTPSQAHNDAANNSHSIASTTPQTTPHAPSRRGRKPGPLSRSAREAQRKLNHSIIEKARRTKINEALATLRQLVPADYNGHKSKEKETESDDDDDEDYDDGAKKKTKPKGTGKREEKEKEFKLEILVRTVAYMQELLHRVGELESGVPQSCSNCSKKLSSKRKRAEDEQEGEEVNGLDKEAALARTTSVSPRYLGSPLASSPATAVTKALNAPSRRPTTSPDPPSRLPPISSWLPDSQIDPRLLPTPTVLPPISNVSHLPSPPSSTRFDPVRNSQAPPALALGPVATSAMLTPPQRTPEDESAASLLLQIASSPPLPPTFTGPAPPDAFTLQRGATKHDSLPAPTKYPIQAHTPSSLLGLGRVG